MNLAYCPHCNVPVRHLSYAGSNAYGCSIKNCPILYYITVLYPKGTVFANNAIEDLPKGIIVKFCFEIENLFGEVQSAQQSRIYNAITPSKIPWDNDPVFYLSKTSWKEDDRIWFPEDGTNKKIRKHWDDITHLPFNFELDFQNLPNLVKKLKMLTVFS